MIQTHTTSNLSLLLFVGLILIHIYESSAFVVYPNQSIQIRPSSIDKNAKASFFSIQNQQNTRHTFVSSTTLQSTPIRNDIIEEMEEYDLEQDIQKTNSKSSNENNEKDPNISNIVLVAGFESFNRELYQKAITLLPSFISSKISLTVFSDSEIRVNAAAGGGVHIDTNTNPEFVKALQSADLFIGSLIFDYDDVLAVQQLLPSVKGPRLCFECATELMEFNHVGTFSMEPKQDGSSNGPPPAVKAVLSKFSSGKEEDKLSGYIKLLKIGPQLLQYVPGEKAKDLRTWLEAYRYWNQGGIENVSSMLQLLYQRCLASHHNISNENNAQQIEDLPLPELEITPDLGLLHPLLSSPKTSTNSHNPIPTTQKKYFQSPREYLDWRESDTFQKLATQSNYKAAPLTAPRVAILLYRKHVITKQKYIWDLITIMEREGILPIPIFINGVEAHTIVRDLLTSFDEIQKVNQNLIQRDDTYKPSEAVRVDAIVNTVGFPLVGGPAGSLQAGRNIEVSQTLLSNMNVPYIVSGPLLLQSIEQWRQSGVLGLQSVALYSLPELDGAIDTVVLGGLVGDRIGIVPERIRKLLDRVRAWVELRRTPKQDRKISIMVYGFPPNVGAVGTAALLDVPKSLEKMLRQMHDDGYNIGTFANDPDASGESLVAALATLCEDSVISSGADKMQAAVDAKIERAKLGDKTVAETLSKPGGGLGGAVVKAFDITNDELDETLGKYMAKKVRKMWPEKERGPSVSAAGNLVVSGLQIGNVHITVQPLLGLEGDPMRLLFERDLTPHPQYCAAYEWMKKPVIDGGIGTQAVIHLGMHGTVEWLPGQPLGNDRQSWSDQLIGSIPNIYIYAANNPSESILAKRRGYGTLVSYNVPPYGRSGLYLELANLKDLIDEYRETMMPNKSYNAGDQDLKDAIWASCQRSGLTNDVPFLINENDHDIVYTEPDLPKNLPSSVFNSWLASVSEYLILLQERLFSSGLHTLGSNPTNDDLKAYLEAYFGDRLSDIDDDEILNLLNNSMENKKKDNENSFFERIQKFLSSLSNQVDMETQENQSSEPSARSATLAEASHIVSLLRKNTEELDGVLTALEGGYVRPAPGGDLLRDGTSVLPTGRNIHALDPYRMPSAGAWARGQRIAAETLRQHQLANDGEYPETVAVTLWGLDAIKTRGESVAIVLALVGAKPVKEGTGRVVRFDLIPLEELGRPRVDVLASLSGIFRDSFANVVDLLDDMFERASTADEPNEMNYIKKHSNELQADGVERPAARLFSNPPGDYGSMVNEIVGSGDWNEAESLGETWTSRNTFSYGRNEGKGGIQTGTARPQVLEKLLSTTERVVQEVDSVEYGLTDIQEYYANTGALKKAAENRKSIDPKTGKRKKVVVSVVEAFTGNQDDDPTKTIPVRDVEDVLRLEYRSKFLNPKWRDAMLEQGSGGAYEISQRMTAMVGWAATSEIDNFVFDEAAERYALDEDVAAKLQKSNPEAFKNVIRRLLEAQGRGMWETDEDTLEKLRELYSDADDLVEQVGMKQV